MKLISGQMTNRIMAISAIVISAASFYVAVLQTKATQQQVKAETWPYLQIDSGNYDSDSASKIINYTLVNAGVGPARVESMQVFYQGNLIKSFDDLTRQCCIKDLEVSAGQALLKNKQVGTAISANPSPVILPSESKVDLFRLYLDDNNQVFWDHINKVRNQLQSEACYCSVLDECWVTNFRDKPKPTSHCQSSPEQDYSG